MNAIIRIFLIPYRRADASSIKNTLRPPRNVRIYRKKRKEKAQRQGAQKDANRAEEHNAAEYRKQDEKRMKVHPAADELRAQNIVDESDGEGAPDKESDSLWSFPCEKEKYDRGDKDERGPDARYERRDCGHRPPQNRARYAEECEAYHGEYPLHERYREITFDDRIDCVLKPVEDTRVVAVAEW